MQEVIIVVSSLATLITSGGVILKFAKNSFTKVIHEELVPIKDDLSELKTNQREIDMNATKNYLSKCFNDLKQGQELSESCKQRIYEEMEHYEGLGGNSYIHQEFENLKNQGKL